eukprot:TRINITY_DN59132_c0_g1_i1.p1 TRINITY_DN59132_c0_g1~~TRINITY_DN59132_c0_g1_i1.p1  ORF type:complete len:164 (+),score=28.31 TRINITY_DN59132_c0_g1_i1:42-533(+)
MEQRVPNVRKEKQEAPSVSLDSLASSDQAALLHVALDDMNENPMSGRTRGRRCVSSLEEGKNHKRNQGYHMAHSFVQSVQPVAPSLSDLVRAHGVPLSSAPSIESGRRLDSDPSQLVERTVSGGNERRRTVPRMNSPVLVFSSVQSALNHVNSLERGHKGSRG